MRPFTMCYSLMTLALGSVAVYGITNLESLQSPFGDPRVFAANASTESEPTIILPPATAPKPAELAGCCADDKVTVTESSVSAPAVAAPLTPTVVAGMSSGEVRALLGDPDDISPDGARWTYGSSVLIFSNEKLSGHVAFDPIQAALNRYNNMIASLSIREAPQASTSDGPEVLHSKASTPRNATRYQYRPIPAGSARQAYRYDRDNNEYSYYMNRMGPLDRIFSGKRFLPRGMTSSTQRNLGQAYLNYGSSRYSTPSNTQYRR